MVRLGDSCCGIAYSFFDPLIESVGEIKERFKKINYRACPKGEICLKEVGLFLIPNHNLKEGVVMKKKISLILFLIIFVLSATVFSNKVQPLSKDNETRSVTDNSTLILYYSMTGKSKIVAEELNSLVPGSKLVEVKSDASIPAAIFWYKLPFTKADIEPLNINFDDYDRIFLCTPIYMQGISPAIKAVIKDASFFNIIVSKGDGMLHYPKGNIMLGKNVDEAYEKLNNPTHEDLLDQIFGAVEDTW